MKRPEGAMADVNPPASDELEQWKADRDMWMANATRLVDERDDALAELRISEDACKAMNVERMDALAERDAAQSSLETWFRLDDRLREVTGEKSLPADECLEKLVAERDEFERHRASLLLENHKMREERDDAVAERDRLEAHMESCPNLTQWDADNYGKVLLERDRLVAAVKWLEKDRRTHRIDGGVEKLPMPDDIRATLDRVLSEES